MNRLEQRPEVQARSAAAAPLSSAPRNSVIDLLEVDDDLSSVRGLVAAVVLSVPVWAGLGYVAWKVFH